MQTLIETHITQAPVVELTRKPQPLTKALEIDRIETAISSCEDPRSTESLRLLREVENARVDLVLEVMTENPNEAYAAVRSASLAAAAIESFNRGKISLEVRNHAATRASEFRQVILEKAQAFLDRTKGGWYLPQTSIPSLHLI